MFMLYCISIDNQENALGYNRKYTIDTDTRPFFYYAKYCARKMLVVQCLVLQPKAEALEPTFQPKAEINLEIGLQPKAEFPNLNPSDFG